MNYIDDLNKLKNAVNDFERAKAQVLLISISSFLESIADRLPEEHPLVIIDWRNHDSISCFEGFTSALDHNKSANLLTRTLTKSEKEYLKNWLRSMHVLDFLFMTDKFGLQNRKVKLAMSRCVVHQAGTPQMHVGYAPKVLSW